MSSWNHETISKKSVLWTILIVIIGFVLYGVYEYRSSESAGEGPIVIQHADLKGIVRIDPPFMKITNKNDYTWNPTRTSLGQVIRIQINYKFTGWHKLPIKPGETASIPLALFSKTDGERFNFLTHRAKEIYIQCDENSGSYQLR